MADTTNHETERTRAATADLLRSIADELESDSPQIRVAVGNKNVYLTPPDQIGTAITVTERSRRFRTDIEELSLSFRWHPTNETADKPTGESQSDR